MNKYTAWECGTVFGETIHFTEDGPNRLAYPVRKILAAYNPTLGVQYEEGKDWIFRDGSFIIPENSRIHVCPNSECFHDPKSENAIQYPEKGANAIGDAHGSPTGCLIFSLEDGLIRKQVSFDYETDPAYLPKTAPMPDDKFPEIRKKNEPLKFLFIGDSITEGLNSTGFINLPPYLPSYARRTAEYFGAEYNNYAVAGTASPKGIEQLDKANAANVRPDILFVAFGMNELHSETETFRSNLLNIIAHARKLFGNIGIVLVSQMAGNELWTPIPPGKDIAFAEIMRQLAAEDR